MQQGRRSIGWADGSDRCTAETIVFQRIRTKPQARSAGSWRQNGVYLVLGSAGELEDRRGHVVMLLDGFAKLMHR